MTRWRDLTPPVADTALDLSADCRELGRALEAAINTDRDDTGFTIAPNLLWHTALAVGATSPPYRGLRLLELPPHDDGKEVEFSLDSPPIPISTPPPVDLPEVQSHR